MHYSVIALALAMTVIVSSEASLIVPTINNEAPSENKFELIDVNEYDLDQRIVDVECLGCLEDGGDGVLVFDLVLSNVKWPPRLLVNGKSAHWNMTIESSDTNNPYMPPPISALLFPAKATPHELLTQDLKPKDVKVIYTIFYSEFDHRFTETFRYFLEVTNVDGRDIKPGQTLAKFCLMMQGHGTVMFDGWCDFDNDSIETGGDSSSPAFPEAIFVLLVLVAIVNVAAAGRFLVAACLKANKAWKGKKMGGLFLPEHNAGEREVLLSREENYQL